jgi:archaellum component FlaG (FlaF/FlaG flagellin family)
MKKFNFKYMVLSVVILSLHLTSFGQSGFKLNETQSKLVIKGTSSVHNWEINVSEFNCDASLLNNENQVVKISDVNFVCLVKNVKSDNKTMNNKTFEALKGDKFPQIKFISSESLTASTVWAASNVKGKITIAGKTNDAILQIQVVAENQNQINVKGETRLKMSDYGIDPPVAMMGVLKTGNEVVITYDFVFQKIHEIN